MDMSEYKKYSLENLENWMHDAMSCTEASPQEIYDVIKGVVEENYYLYKNQTSQAYELLALLNGNGKGHISEEHSEYYYDFDRNKPVKKTCDKDDPSLECKKSWTSFWEEPSMPPWGHSDIEYGLQYTDEELNAMCDAAEKQDKVKNWVLPVEECKDADTDETEYFVSFPDDLLKASDLKAGDEIEWVEQKDGSYLLRKVNKIAHHPV